MRKSRLVTIRHAVVYPWEYWNEFLVAGCDVYPGANQLGLETLKSANLFSYIPLPNTVSYPIICIFQTVDILIIIIAPLLILRYMLVNRRCQHSRNGGTVVDLVQRAGVKQAVWASDGSNCKAQNIRTRNHPMATEVFIIAKKQL